MHKIFNDAQRALALTAALLFMASGTHASPITFTYTGYGTGKIGTTSFFNNAFTFTQLADTNDIVGISGCEGCLSLTALSATVTLDGIGTYAFTSSTRTFYNNGVVGFSRNGSGGDLYNTFFVGTDYRLNSTIGPAPFFTGAPGLLQWSNSAVTTSKGVLYFSALNTPGTFQANAVPIPAAGWLLGSSLAGLIAAGRRRKKIN